MRPRASIRRFDVFAEYNRQKANREGMPSDQAKGYGLWLAKVVAARRFGAAKHPAADRGREKTEVSRGKWRRLGGKPQTDDLFDKEIVSRMGRPFYGKVFVPAIRRAIDHQETYTEIRDRIRRDWTP